MNVIAINASPREKSNTGAAIAAIARELKNENIDTETIAIGTKQIQGCQSCGSCWKTGVCALNDGANDIIMKMRAADGIIIGSPVYYAGINGTLKAFLDRAFYSSGEAFRFKPCAGVVVARRAGTTAALEQINKYFEIGEMLMTPTIYWSGLHGAASGEAAEDLEGMQMMEQIGRNMAYLLKLQAASKVPLPERDKKVWYNFIRK
jgi:multimeric flavodoxin WrbA